VLLAVVAGLFAVRSGGQEPAAADAGGAKEQAPAEQAAEQADDQDAGEGAIGFPSDRLRERQLDRARRLLADERWSDAAALFDEILAADKDFFFRGEKQSTWQSIKAEANRLIGALARPGREAYELQFRARADRLLEQAVAADDAAGIVAVARRWFHTPAGYRATLLASIEALESNQPLAAAAWLDRLASADAAAYEPTLSVMRAVAWFRAGDRAAAAAILDKARGSGRTVARIGGREVTISFPAGGGLDWLVNLVGETKRPRGGQGGDWLMHRGDAARNGLAAASCPLLVPRYRVPLSRHPEEARQLEARRRQHADQELPLMPAGVPLAVNGTILAHTPLGLLAVDFETGKRIWLQAGGAAAAPRAGDGDGNGNADAPDADPSGSFSSTFEDGTSGMLASDGRLVFVVESPADAVTSQPPANGRPGLQGLQFGGGFPGGWRGNTLSAYDPAARGALVWRLPARQAPQADDTARPAAPSGAWFLGAPLPAGEQLLVAVEEKGEIRLDVLDAATGRVEWSQPLAEIDEDRAIDNRDSHRRRLAGLSPALSEGVVVCPTGAGAVVAVDLATRTLLWAHDYPQTPQGDVITLPNGIRVRRGNGNVVVINGQIGGPAAAVGTGRWLDSAPVLAAGRVLLAPGESAELHCLDLRSGSLVWRQPRRDRLYVAGVVDGRAIVVGRRGVEALELDTGKTAWSRPFAADQGSPSGRGILTANRLFLPLDTPEVIEIDIADGRIAARAPSRGNAVPGNLVAYRGEVVSQGADSLDVFHQTAALESRIETAEERRPGDPWALLWSGQRELDRGDVARGLDLVRRAHEADPERVSALVVGQAMAFALRRDFARGSASWREAAALAGSAAGTAAVLRTAVDGFLAAGDDRQAWEALGQLLETVAGGGAAGLDGSMAVAGGPAAGVAGGLVPDGADPALAETPARWMQGRLAELRGRATPPVREAIDAFVAAQARGLADPDAAAADPDGRLARLRRFIERFGRHDAAVAARWQLADGLRGAIAAKGGAEDGRDVVIERDLLLIELSRLGRPAERGRAIEELAAVRREFAAGAAGGAAAAGGDPAEAWPIGKVTHRRGAAGLVARAGDSAEEPRFVRSRMMHVPVVGGSESFLPGLDLAVDIHQQTGIVPTDGLGRQIGEPLRLVPRAETARLMPVLSPGADEASVLGRCVFIRAGATLAAFDLAGQPGGGRPAGRPGRAEATGRRNRQLWLVADKADPTADARAAGFAMPIAHGRIGRDGAVPLGVRASEPRGADDAARRGVVRGARARCTGVPVLVDRSLRVYDPRTGALQWERHRLPAGSDLFGDDDHLCVCPPDGRQSLVLSMVDGRRVRVVDLPRSEQRLLTAGRRIVAVQPSPPEAGEAWARRVTLELVDPLGGERIALGDFPGESRAASAGDGRLAVVEPSGGLTLLDLDEGREAFRTRLPDMPAGLDQLQVTAWADRYLVTVGRSETEREQAELNRIGSIGALPGMPGSELPQLVTGSIWAVDRATGDSLWPVPVTILRHGPQRHHATELPVLVFARSVQPARETARPRLSVLCLDKRTGQAVYVNDNFNGGGQPRPDTALLGLNLSGDPAAHTIALSQGRRDAPDVVLEYTGGPAAPAPPFQAGPAPAAGGASILDIDFWMQRIFRIPAPF